MQTNGAKPRARLQIVNWIGQFSLSRGHGPGKPFAGSQNFRYALNHDDIQPGQLVAIQAAPVSKWWLSWVIETIPAVAVNYAPSYALESIEDGEVSNWTNIGLLIYDDGAVKDNPQWRWTDRQFEFNDRWHKVCNQIDGYSNRPMRARFGDGNSVTLPVRARFSDPPTIPEQTFPNWKKVTNKMMAESYNRAVNEIDDEHKIRKAKAAG